MMKERNDALRIAREQALLENLVAYQLGLSPPHYPMPAKLMHETNLVLVSIVQRNAWVTT